MSDDMSIAELFMIGRLSLTFDSLIFVVLKAANVLCLDLEFGDVYCG